MEELLRGYVNANGEQSSFYFENSVPNIANFIYNNAGTNKEIIVETLFGKLLLKTVDLSLNITGRSSYVEKIGSYLCKLKDGTIKSETVNYLDLTDLNNKDEFDSKDLDEKEFVRLYDGH